MSRRASNTVRHAREFARRCGVTLDRNGFPVLDPPHEANKLPARCPPGMHEFARVKRTPIEGFYDDGEWVQIVRVEFRCRHCTEKSIATEIV